MVPPYIKPDDTVVSGSFSPVVESQITDSEGHPWKVSSSPSSGDVGGEFYTQKRYAVINPLKVSLREETTNSYGNTEIVTYDGVAFPVMPATTAFPPSGQSSNFQLDQLGATAVARCKPTNSVADVSVAIAELLREGLPHKVGQLFWKSKTDVARKGGSEYLNLQFGWVPMIKEVEKFASAVIRADQLLTQYERDAGRIVRRRYNFPSKRSVVTDVVETGVAAKLPPGITAFTNTSDLGSVIRTRETVQRQWFSGAFTYHLPRGYNSRKEMERKALLANKVLGIELTPQVLWNLAPWSWAVDWFTNTGDVVSNLTDWAFDGLVMRYGYMMEHTIVSDSYVSTRGGHRGLAEGIAGFTLVTETKVRRRANPFGFGVSWDGLSPFQLSIAAALGLSKS